MSKLLRANFSRLFKSKFFRVSSAVMFLFGFIPVITYFDNKECYELYYYYDEYTKPLDEVFFIYIIAIFFVTTISTALFVGVEYSSGTIHNKLAIGTKRITIYLSNLITLAVANAIWSAVCIITTLCVGIPLLGTFVDGLPMVILYVFFGYVLTCTVTSIMLMISMLCPNKAYSITLCLVTAILLIAFALIISWVFDYSPFYEYSQTDYVDKTEIMILDKLFKCSLGGQLLQIVVREVDNVAQFILCDVALSVLTTGIGILKFKRKELR